MSTAPLPPSFDFPRPASDTGDLAQGSPALFPAAALPPLVREVAEDMARVYQVPICLPAMSAIAVLSGAIGKSVVVTAAFKDKMTRLNIYVIAASERGTGKGNTAESLARPITERSAQLTERQRDITAAQRGELGILKKEVSRKETEAASATGSERHEIEASLAQKHLRLDHLEREAKRKRTLHVANATGPALAARLEDNDETLFSYSSEAGASLRTALGRFNDDGGGDFDLLLSGYSGDTYKDDRVGRDGVSLVSPCLSLLWLAQGSILRELLANPEAFDRGLTARPLIFASGAERQLDDRSNRALITSEAWSHLIDGILDRRLSRKGQDPIVITASSSAREVFADFNDESVRLGRGPFADLDGELTRWRENAIKVAGLFAMAENTDTVTADHARRGCEIVRWSGYSYLGLLHAGRKERQRQHLDRLLDLLRVKGGSITLRDLERHHAITKDIVNSAVAAFPDELTVERIATGIAGRPSIILRLPGAKSAKSDNTPNEGDNADNADFAEGGIE